MEEFPLKHRSLPPLFRMKMTVAGGRYRVTASTRSEPRHASGPSWVHRGTQPGGRLGYALHHTKRT